MALFSFLGRGGEAPSLQFYGKLPLAKDYLRVGCADGSARELREWLDRTFGAARDAEQPLVLEEGQRFFGQGSSDPIQGLIWPSTDAGGHRKFPFTVFVERRRKVLANDIDSGGLAHTERVWRQLATVRDECLEAKDGQELLGAQRGRELDLSGEDSVVVSSSDFDAWVDVLWPREGRAGFDDVVARLAEAVRRREAVPYRLPLVRECPMREQVLGWITALRTIGALSPDEIPTVYIPMRSLVSSTAPAQAVVSARPLTDSEVGWLAASADTKLGPTDFASPERDGDSADLHGESGALGSFGRAFAAAVAKHGGRST